MVAGASFALAQYLTSNFIGPELPAITSAIFHCCANYLLKFWKPTNVKRGHVSEELERDIKNTYKGEVFKAWSPFLVLTVMVTLWTLKPFKALFAKGGLLASSV